MAKISPQTQTRIAIGVIVVVVIGLVFLLLWLVGIFGARLSAGEGGPPARQLFNTYVLSDDDKWTHWDDGGVETSGEGNQDLVDRLFVVQNKKAVAEFGDNRVLVLLLPGVHTLEIEVGYYTSVVGVGETPTDTVVKGYVEVPNDDNACIGALDNFFRNVSNLTIDLTKPVNFFRVSQASPIRNIVVRNGDFAVAQYDFCTEVGGNGLGGYASGGYMANVRVANGSLLFSTQQQFFTRNSQFNRTEEGSWNMFYMGCEGDIPQTDCPINGITLVTDIPRIAGPIAAAPRIRYQVGGTVSILKPALHTSSRGVLGPSPGDEVLTDVFVVNPQTEIGFINEKLAEGVHLVFSPGIYSFAEPVRITKSGTVVLGLGYATIVPSAANAALVVADGTEGIRVGGFILQAGGAVGGNKTHALLVVGETDNSTGNEENPNILFDIFPRVGGPDHTGTCDIMILVNQQNTVFDHIWCWRADHTGVLAEERSGLGPDKAQVDTAVVVKADKVTMYGVFAEHTLKDQIIWNGNQGRLFFQQTELPYDVSRGWDFPGLKVTGQDFFGTGIGIYSFFARKWHQGNAPSVETAVVTPADATVDACFTVFLDPDAGGGSIESVINGKGGVSDITAPGQPQWWVCNDGEEWGLCQNNPRVCSAE